jgi:hypothetical protein
MDAWNVIQLFKNFSFLDIFTRKQSGKLSTTKPSLSQTREPTAEPQYLQHNLLKTVLSSFCNVFDQNFSTLRISRAITVSLLNRRQNQIMSLASAPIELNKFKDAILEISVENCQLVKFQLQNSIQRLLETNDELNDEIDQVRNKIQNLKPQDSHDELRDDLLLYLESVDENNHVIVNQKLRIFAINDELVRRGIENQQDIDKEHQEYNRMLEEKLARFGQSTKQSVIYNMLKADKNSMKQTENEPQTKSEEKDSVENENEPEPKEAKEKYSGGKETEHANESGENDLGASSKDKAKYTPEEASEVNSTDEGIYL